jgi:O-antigen/teichoic acid export membrane protein
MILFAFGRIAQVFLALATMRLATTFLSPQEMGRMTLILAVTSVYSLFFVSPTGMFITRRLHSWYESGKLPHYLIYHFIFLIFVSVFAAVTILIFLDLSLLTINVQVGWLIALVCSSLLVTTSSQTLVSAINILGYRNLFVWLSLLTGCASLILSVYLVTAIGKESYIWILGIIIGQAMGAIFGLSALINKGLLRRASKKELFGIHKNSLEFPYHNIPTRIQPLITQFQIPAIQLA